MVTATACDEIVGAPTTGGVDVGMGRRDSFVGHRQLNSDDAEVCQMLISFDITFASSIEMTS